MNQEVKEWMIVAKQNHLNKLSKLHDLLITEIAILDKELQDLNKTEYDDLVSQKIPALYLTTGDNEEIYNFEETIYLVNKERFTKYSNDGNKLRLLRVDKIDTNWITFKSKEKANNYIIENGNWITVIEANIKMNGGLYNYIKDKLTKENKLYL